MEINAVEACSTTLFSYIGNKVIKDRNFPDK